VTPSLDELLARDGPIARGLNRYEHRPQQEELARAVAECLAAREHLLAEAGTGVGKSFAYLLPAILHALQEAKGPVIVSTRTIALQEQLVRKDLPFLASVLPLQFTSVVAMGRNNYLCLRRMERAVAERNALFKDLEEHEQVQRIAAWSGTTREGTRQDLPFQPLHQVWEEVQAEHGNCLHARCPHFGRCHYQRGRRGMTTAHVVVVNHALYFADLALRKAGASYLPDHQAVVFDEAHHLERTATEALSADISPLSVEWHLRRLYSKDGRRGLLTQVEDQQGFLLIELARERAQGFFGRLEGWLTSRSGEGSTAAITAADRFDNDLSPALMSVAERIDQLAASIENVTLRMELEARSAGLARLALGIEALTGAELPGVVRWVEWSRKSPMLRGAPLSVKDDLQKHLFGRVPTCVLVSATLGGGPGDPEFLWLRARLGIEQARVKRLGSPFPYEQRVVVDVASDLPDPVREPKAFEDEAIARVRDLCVDNRGRALVLCTSWKFVERCAAGIAPALEALGITLLKQGAQSLGKLLERKRDDPDTVLIGADSLWEGIDLPGPNLDLVIICRLPFVVPTHPLTKARAQAVEQAGGSSFHDLFLPEAILRFRQGFGRLVRTMDDRGRVVVLDPRMRTKSYGRLFAEALPVLPRPEM
jgi:ATP-dependent DNA helicase DinG